MAVQQLDHRGFRFVLPGAERSSRRCGRKCSTHLDFGDVGRRPAFLVPELLFRQAYHPFPTYPNRSSTMAPKKPMKDLKKGVNKKTASSIKGGRKKLPSK